MSKFKNDYDEDAVYAASSTRTYARLAGGVAGPGGGREQYKKTVKQLASCNIGGAGDKKVGG